MAYPGSFFEWEDNSAIPQKVSVDQVDNSPLFAALFTSDMGPEEWTTTVGKDFFELYGSNISFAKHGQPLLQAAMQINKGAKLYCKRIVANDAAFANLGVIATVTKATAGGEPVTDDLGTPLYYAKDPMTGANLETTTTDTTTEVDDGTGTGTTVTQNNDPVLTKATAASVKYESFSVEGASSIQEVYDKFENEYDAAAGRFPLFIFVENGRGISNKSWYIIPRYDLSKNLSYMVYTFSLLIDGKVSEDKNYNFTFNPNYILDGKSFCLQQRIADYTKQIKCKEYDSYITDFMAALAEAMSTDTATVTVDDIKNHDVLFGCTRKGLPLTDVVEYVANEEFTLEASYGNKLVNGSTGSFGEYPLKANSTDPTTDNYTKAMLRALDPDLCPEIYDVENNKFIAIFDADYPVEVKNKIEELAIYREDFMFFRDFGTKANKTLNEILDVFTGNEETLGVAKSRYIKAYPQYGDVMDPYTLKQITVSITYLMALKFINHYMNGVNRPFAGIRYNVTFPEIIPGTLNFAPSVTPKYDQKTQMVENRINYMGYHNELLVLETDYTTQEQYTQWSFGCNVMATQAVIRAIRDRCPTTRYALTTEAGLNEYEQDINSKVLSNFSSWFDVLQFKYVGDAITLANKQYYAAISVKFTDFIQEEYFKVTALPAVSASE